jgi:D-glycero-alpha-D-manno-heptose-7-phosphate kinase
MTRTPLRISIGGGGTDLPSYYRENGGGFVISAAITKYVYITVNRSFLPGYFLKYSETEHADTCDQIRHPLMREAISLHHAP